MNQPDHIRCSDDERRIVEQVLSAAYADGRLSREEHGERMTAVWQAKTYGELRPITADLVVVEAQVRRLHEPVPDDGFPRAVVDSVDARSETDHINALMSTRVRTDDAWRLRQRTNVSCIMGEVKLNLTQATFDSQRAVVNASIVMGSMILQVPAGVTVRDETTPIMGEVKIVGLIPDEHGPEIVLTGFALMSEIKVVGPNHKSFLKKKLFK